MDSSTLLWTVDTTRGSVNFGRLIPFAGNTYELVFAGVAIEEEYTAYVMDESGLKCLAKSEHNAGEYKIAFNTADLRDEFERNMHEVRTFHVIVRDSKRVVAEGDLSVQWQSLWEDATTGEVYSMRGPQGFPGAAGRKGEPGTPGQSAYELACSHGFVGTEEQWLLSLRGRPGASTKVYDAKDNLWHTIGITQNKRGEKVLAIEQEGEEWTPDESDRYVMLYGDQQIKGKKKFEEAIEGSITGKAVYDGKGNKIDETYLPLSGGRVAGEASFDNNVYCKTPPLDDSSNRVANTEFVKDQLSEILSGVSIPTSFRGEGVYDVDISEDKTRFPRANKCFPFLILGNRGASEQAVQISGLVSYDGELTIRVPSGEIVIKDLSQYSFMSLSGNSICKITSESADLYGYAVVYYCL